MATRPQVDLVIAGGASHVVGLAGAASVVDERSDVVRVGGTSAGALVAAAIAMGMHGDEILAVIRRLLRGDLLDLSMWPLHRWGIYKGDALGRALASVFGDARMGDVFIPLRVVVCDLYTRQPMIIDSADPDHARLRIVDVLRCSSAIPGFFRAHTLPEVFGSRLFVDGGTAANFAMHIFDDSLRPTLGLRLQREADPAPRPVRSTRDYILAMVELLLWASDNAHISTKKWSDVLQIPVVGSGLDFDLDDDTITARWDAGVRAAKGWDHAG